MKKGILLISICALVLINGFTVSAADRLSEGEFTAEINEDGSSVTLAKYHGTDLAIEIPSELKGMPVTGIGFWTFWGEEIYELIIPDSVVEIDKNMFENDMSLENYVVGEDNPRFMEIDGVLFDKIENELYLYPEGRTECSYELPEGIAGIGECAFSDCGGLEELITPESCKRIEDSAFADCVELTDVSLAEGLESIGAKAFSNCTNLTDFVIPASVQEIGEQAFVNLRSVSEFAVAQGNETYTAADGVLFRTTDGMLMNYPLAKDVSEYSVPEGTESIGRSAFRFCGHLNKVVLADGIEKIGQEAFFRCSNLQELTVPASVTEIGPDAFAGCPELVLIVEDGSYAQEYAQENNISYK